MAPCHPPLTQICSGLDMCHNFYILWIQLVGLLWREIVLITPTPPPPPPVRGASELIHTITVLDLSEPGI